MRTRWLPRGNAAQHAGMHACMPGGPRQEMSLHRESHQAAWQPDATEVHACMQVDHGTGQASPLPPGQRDRHACMQAGPGPEGSGPRQGALPGTPSRSSGGGMHAWVWVLREACTPPLKPVTEPSACRGGACMHAGWAPAQPDGRGPPHGTKMGIEALWIGLSTGVEGTLMGSGLGA